MLQQRLAPTRKVHISGSIIRRAQSSQCSKGTLGPDESCQFITAPNNTWYWACITSLRITARKTCQHELVNILQEACPCCGRPIMAVAKSCTLLVGSTDTKVRAIIGHRDHVDKHQEGVDWVGRQCEWPQRRFDTADRYGQCPLEQAANTTLMACLLALLVGAKVNLECKTQRMNGEGRA